MVARMPVRPLRQGGSTTLFRGEKKLEIKDESKVEPIVSQIDQESAAQGNIPFYFWSPLLCASGSGAPCSTSRDDTYTFVVLLSSWVLTLRQQSINCC